MDKSTVVRVIVFFLAWLNTLLANTAYDLSWINEESVSLFVAFVWSLWTGWKDNDITKKAIEAKKKGDGEE
jgi:SPP1 family holin